MGFRHHRGCDPHDGGSCMRSRSGGTRVGEFAVVGAQQAQVLGPLWASEGVANSESFRAHAHAGWERHRVLRRATFGARSAGAATTPQRAPLPPSGTGPAAHAPRRDSRGDASLWKRTKRRIQPVGLFRSATKVLEADVPPNLVKKLGFRHQRGLVFRGRRGYTVILRGAARGELPDATPVTRALSGLRGGVIWSDSV